MSPPLQEIYSLNCSSSYRFLGRVQLITIRKSADRGFADHGWLKSFHSFSFAGYYDPQHMNWGNLRVINEDRIEPGTGFSTHGHKDMEIISYVLTGELAHKDSMGNVVSIPPGDIQRMSAGSGVMHSEFNHAPTQTTHFFQIWIEPNEFNIQPSYEQKTVEPSSKRGKLALLASNQPDERSVKIHADASLYAGLFDAAERFETPLDSKRRAYVHLVKGQLKVNGHDMLAGDALLLEQEHNLVLEQGQGAEVLVFDLN